MEEDAGRREGAREKVAGGGRGCCGGGDAGPEATAVADWKDRARERMGILEARRRFPGDLGRNFRRA